MTRSSFLSVLVASLLLTGCVVTEQDLQTQRDLLEMKRRLGDVERVLKELLDDTSGGVRAHVETLARNQADFQAELDGMRVDQQSMQGRAGDQERINDDLRHASEEYSDYDHRTKADCQRASKFPKRSA